MAALTGTIRTDARAGRVGGGSRTTCALAVRFAAYRSTHPTLMRTRYNPGAFGAGSMPNYRRWRVPGASYFFELNLADRRRKLLIERVDDLREAFRQVRLNHPFHIDAIVVLPEHLHCIWTLPL